MKPVQIIGLSLLLVGSMISCTMPADNEEKIERPNILFAIADDQSYPYASAYGTPGISTPAFDQIANSGVLFHNAFVAAPQCSPSRAAILTGRNIWQLEEAGTHASSFPKEYQVFTEMLEEDGYAIGFTGKPWGPGNWEIEGWQRNPVGPEFNELVLEEVPANGINRRDYYGNFKQFLEQRDSSKPFFFWYGCHEPHRVYEAGSGASGGKNAHHVALPSFLPDDSVTRNDLMDYAFEIEYFDHHLKKMLNHLQNIGQLENTMVVVTADNGMPFPCAKANLQEYGTHVPLAISWPAGIKNIQVTDELISMIDLAPTFLEITGTKPPEYITGRSMVSLLKSNSNASKSIRDFVLTGRERHTHARPDNLGYPARAIRTKEFLYVKNYHPNRWPVGDPVTDTRENQQRSAVKGFKELMPGYHDIDGSPSKSFMMENSKAYPLLFSSAFSKRNGEQLYDIKNDPGCINDLSGDPEYFDTKEQLRIILDEQLAKQRDPRMSGSEVFDSYPRYSPMRNFEGFNKRGKYNTDYQ